MVEYRSQRTEGPVRRPTMEEAIGGFGGRRGVNLTKGVGFDDYEFMLPEHVQVKLSVRPSGKLAVNREYDPSNNLDVQYIFNAGGD